MNEEEYFRRADELMRRQTVGRALNALGEDPKKAADAVQLEKATGADPQMIYGDYDNFTENYRSFLTQRMLDRNPGIADYINAHPMSAIVSKNDWNRMADFYDHMDYYLGNHYHKRPIKAWINAQYGFVEGFKEAMKAPLSAPKPKEMEQLRETFGETGAEYIAEAWKGFKGPFETAMMMFSGLIHGTAKGVEEGTRALGVEPGHARRIGREAGAFLEFATTDIAAGGIHMEPTARVIQNVMADRAWKLGEPYLKAGELPPVGVHPVWDAVVRADVEHRMSVFDALVDAADKTDTKVQSPDLMHLAAAVRASNEQIYIHWDAVQKLYGEKVPEVGDGILGDVPGIIKQFQDAIDMATDIQVPLSEWVSRVPEEVVKALHDDIRLRPGDPTLNETKTFPKLEQEVKNIVEPKVEEAQPVGKAPIEELVTTPEGAVEAPLDRLLRLRTEYADRLATHGAIEHVPVPEGNLLLSLAAVTGRTFEADKVSRAMRWAFLNNRADIVDRALELARLSDSQLHARLETELSNLNKYADAQNAVKTELAARPLGWTDVETATEGRFRTLNEWLETGEFQQIGPTTVIKPTGVVTLREQEIINQVMKLFRQMGGPQAGVQLIPAREIRVGEPYPTPARGVHVAPVAGDLHTNPAISFLITALDPDLAPGGPRGTVGHEFIHHLFRYRFLREAEINTLLKASIDKWIEKHSIRTKYEGWPEVVIHEEGVAWEFQDWLKTRLETHEAAGIFRKIADFLDGIRRWVKEKLGYELTPEEIFENIFKGRVGRREPSGEPMYGVSPLERAAKIPALEPEALGLLGILPKGREQKYMKLINADRARDIQHLFEQAFKDEKKRQTPQWNLDYARQYAESLADLKNRPDFRTAAFFRSGVIGNQKMDGLPKLDPTKVSKEDQAVLPKAWFRMRDGYAPDDIASFFGYRTGQELINDLIRFEASRGTDKPQTYLERLARAEAERRMERQFGNLDENILEAARDHAIGLEKFDLLHEETLKLAEMLGQSFTMTKKDFKDRAALAFNESINGQVSVIKYARDIAKSNKAVESRWLAGDVAGAFVERQHTLQLEALAEQAKKFEKDRNAFEKIAKRFSKREVEGLPPEFTNWIHHILNRVQRGKRDPVDLLREIAAHKSQTLKDFVKEKSNESWLPEGYEEMELEFNPQIPVWEALTDTDWAKHIDATTVGEFRAIKSSLDALIKVGRNELTTILEGKALERKAVIGNMVKGFEATMQERLPPVGNPSLYRQIRMKGARLKTMLLQMEYVWGRLDQTPYGGTFYKHFTRPFAEAGNEFRLLVAEYGKRFNTLKRETAAGMRGPEFLQAKIPHDIFAEPLWGKPEEAVPILQNKLLGNGYLSRASLRAIMLNIGNKSNLDKLARGYHVKDPQTIIDWVNKHATKEDWDYVRGVWKIFDDIQNTDDIVTRNITGVALERLPTHKIMTNFGEIDGGYFPMIYDQSRGGGSKAGKIDPDLPLGIKVLTDRGFEIRRTNYAGPVSLSLSPIEHQISRRLRSIAFREVLEESQRFFSNAEFRNAMTRHLGQEYTDMLQPYLRDIAGIRGPIPKGQQALESVFSWFTQNTITAFVGFNPGTVAKHNFTALAQSFKELDHKANLIIAMWDLWSPIPSIRKANRDFLLHGGNQGKAVFEGSGEIKGRRPNWMEALGGETDVITGARTPRSLISKTLSWPIAKIDQELSMVLWHAKYWEIMDQNLGKKTVEDAHYEATAIADQAVRRTHGSTAITSRPEMMRIPLMKPLTALYGFFNHIFNRMYEISWEARKRKNLETGEAHRSSAKHLASQTFFALLPAAVIEEIVTPLFDKEDRSLLTRFAMGLAFPITSSMPMIRDMAHAMFTGHDPSNGIIQGSMKAVTDMARAVQKSGDKNIGDSLQALHTLIGVATGLSSQQLGRWNKFAYNYYVGIDRPSAPAEWYRAFRYGTSKPRRH